MKKRLPLIDTNVLLRFLAADEKDQYKRTLSLFENAKNGSLEIPDLILAEVFFVLASFYNLKKNDLVEKMEFIINYEKFKINRYLIRKVLEIYKENTISFVDAYLCGLVENNKNTFIYTFDKRMKKVAGGKKAVSP